MMAAALVLTTLAVVGAFRAYRVAARKVRNRDKQLTVKAAENTSLRDELILTRQSCDELIRQNRALSEQAKGYQASAAHLAARNTELRDQVDALGGTQPEPTLTEEWLAFVAELPTEEQEYRRD